MRISLNWLKDYIALKPDISVPALSEVLTMAGLEVESVAYLKEACESIYLVPVQIKNSQKFAKISTQEISLAKISVCFEPGDYIGIIEKNKYYEVANYGDIGFSWAAPEPIIIKKSDLLQQEPSKLSEINLFDDVIFTLGITPNRADALSHLGVARELSALLGLSRKYPAMSVSEMSGPTHEKAVVEVSEPKNCPRYGVRVVEHIQIGESPLWLKLRLLSCGVRPINTVVDVTNFVMLALGQPMHAFDWSRINKENSRSKILVRNAQKQEKFISLDGQKHELSKQDLVIADGSQVLALAGVIGGLSSAVSNNTQVILLESAYFSPEIVRASSRRLGIQTESSYRFERGCDPEIVVEALNYAARLLSQISSGKVCREPLDIYRMRVEPREIQLRPSRAQKLLGMSAKDFDEEVIRKKFRDLGIETIAKRGDAIYFRVPPFRSDITREIDLIEEAVRMIGYDKISEPANSHILSGEFSHSKSERVQSRIVDHLVGRGFYEVINYAFLNQRYQEKFIAACSKNSVVMLKNPLSERYGVMRQSLIPALLQNASHNWRNQGHSIRLFERGQVFFRKNNMPERPELPTKDSCCEEESRIAGLLAGNIAYHATDYKSVMYDFFHMKGLITELLSAVGFDVREPHGVISYSAPKNSLYFSRGEVAAIELKNNGVKKIIGHFGRIDPDLTKELDINALVYGFELNSELVKQCGEANKSYQAFSRYPVITRDVALIVEEQIMLQDITSLSGQIQGAQEILQRVQVFDIYRGKSVPNGKKSVAIAFTLQDASRTLTDEEATKFVENFVSLCAEKLGAEIR